MVLKSLATESHDILEQLRGVTEHRSNRAKWCFGKMQALSQRIGTSQWTINRAPGCTTQGIVWCCTLFRSRIPAPESRWVPNKLTSSATFECKKCAVGLNLRQSDNVNVMAEARDVRLGAESANDSRPQKGAGESAG